MECYFEKYNEDTNKFELTSVTSVFGKFDKETFKIVNDAKQNLNFEYDLSTFNPDKVCAQNGVDKLNEKLDSGEVEVKKCKTCRKFFLLFDDEKNWFENRGLNVPVNCKGCRERKRNNNGHR